MKKFGKRKLQFIILALILVVSAGAYGTVKRLDLSEEATDEPMTAFYVSKESVTSIKWKNSSGEELSFKKNGDLWELSDDSEFKVNPVKLQNTLETACDIKSHDLISSVEDMSVYGLTDPYLTIELGLDDGSRRTITVGDMNEMSYDYYIRINDDTDVYTVDSSFLTPFSFDISELEDSVSTSSDADDA